jgi:hypothetical protein
LAHQAASFSATLGAKRLGELFGVLELMSGNSEGPGEIHQEIRRIESEFSSVRQELKQIRERC